MKFKDLLEFTCKEITDMTLEFLRENIIEGLAHKDYKTIVLGTNGEFHYLYSTPFLEEKENVFYCANRFEDGGFDKMLQFDIPEGYWVYFYQSSIDFLEFRNFATFEEAKDCYDKEVFGDDELLVEKALMLFESDTNRFEVLCSERE